MHLYIYDRLIVFIALSSVCTYVNLHKCTVYTFYERILNVYVYIM